MITTGIDLVRVSDVANSIEQFGARYIDRLFTAREQVELGDIGDANRSSHFATMFAAKEATFKTLRLPRLPGDWRSIELVRTSEGWLDVRFHAALKELAIARGVEQLCVSVSHEGDYATAIVMTEYTEAPASPDIGNCS